MTTNLMVPIPVLILILIFAAIFMLRLTNQQRKAVGLPSGKIIASDTSKWTAVDQPFYSARLGLTGKPDYLVRQGEHIIPVEVKSSKNPNRGPYDSHIHQLIAYCILVHEIFDIRPDYGILHYTNDQGKARSFSIPFSEELEAEVHQEIIEIQQHPLRKAVDRSHTSPGRCNGCGYKNECDQALS